MSTIPWTDDERPDTRTTNVRVGMWLFLASEAMLFGSLFSGYVLLRTGAGQWPRTEAFLDVRSALVNTALLAIASLLVMLPGRRNRIWLYVSSAFAIAFLISKALEYRAQLDAGHAPALNLLLACWFTLTFVHALHVAAGAGATLWLAAGRSRTGAAQFRERWRALRLYWSFVDIVWIAILIAFYFS